jgi:hypothetical protein
VRTDEILPRGHVAADAYIWALQSAWDSGVRLYDPDVALVQDPAAGEKMRRDPVIKQAIHDRMTAAAGPDWIIEPATDRERDKEAASIVQDLLREIRNLDVARYALASAILDARSYAEIRGGRLPLAAGSSETLLEWWAPTRLKDIDPRRIRWVPSRDADGVAARQEIWSIDSRAWHVIEDDSTLVQVVFDDTEGRLGYGRGLREALFHVWWAKGIVQREGLQGLERWAQGLPVVKIDVEANRGATETPQDVAARFLEVLRKHRARYGGIAIDREDELDLHEPGEAGARLVQSWLDYLDRVAIRLVTGALLPSGGGSDVGSNARAEVEDDTQERIAQFDRRVIDAALTDSLVRLVWRQNRENLVALGLGEARMPRFRTRQQRLEDPARNAETAKTLLEAGIDLRRDEVYAKTGYTPPVDGDEVFEGREPVADPGGLPIPGKKA